MKSTRSSTPSWKELLYTFTQNTTFHGVRYITSSTKYIVRRLIWIFIVCVATGGFTAIVISRLIYFYGHPKTVDVEVIYTDELAFPAVTICNQNFLRATPIHKIGVYDEISSHFQTTRKRVVNHSESSSEVDVCDDEFKFIRHHRLSEIGNNYRTFSMITVDVCKHVCIAFPEMNCNAFQYDRDDKKCTILSKTKDFDDVMLVYDEKVDYFQRFRCEGPTVIECSFDINLCDFSQSDDEELDWIRSRGETTTPGTGPKRGPSPDKGYYLYLTGDPNQRARLLLPYVQTSTTRCLEFYYHMRGAHIGTLSMYVRYADGQEKLVWQRQGDHGTKWQRAFKQLQSGLFQVVLEGKVGRGPRHQIAIAAITLADCSILRNNCIRSRDGSEYMGNISVTVSGHKCQRWASQTPHKHTYTDSVYFSDETIEDANNNCRNPDNREEGPWCMTTNPYVTCEQCSIPFCSCREDQFTCDNKLCVSNHVVCDGNNDCGDNSDEEAPCVSNRGMNCSFENPYICGFTHGRLGFAWKRHKGKTPSAKTGPNYDHTTGAPKGHYMYTEASLGSPGDIAILSTPQVTITGPHCLQFYYHMYGQHMGNLSIVKMKGGVRREFYHVIGSQGKRWHRMQLDISVSNDETMEFGIEFVLSRGNGFTSDTAIDDISISPKLCDLPDCPANSFRCDNGRLCISEDKLCDGVNDCIDNSDETKPCKSLSCSFDKVTICGYTQSSTDDTYRWERQLCTSTDFGYCIITPSSSLSLGKTTSLMSPWQSVSVKSCLTFWIHMYGSSQGVLKLFTAHEDGTKTFTLHLMGSHGNHWFQRSVEIFSGVQRMIFEATAGFNGKASDIKIAEIKISPRSCDFSYKSINCTFEEDHICGYHVDSDVTQKNVAYQMRRISGAPPSHKHGTAPAVDHTYGNKSGHYMYTEATGGLLGNKAFLFSPYSTVSNTSCLIFFYHMYGINMGEMHVHVETDEHIRHEVWTTSGNHGEKWLKAQINLPPGTFRLVFEGVRGVDHLGDMAIDDITISLGECKLEGCKGNQYQCFNGVCVDRTFLCNGYNDCGDNSDETNVCEHTCKRTLYQTDYLGHLSTTRSGRKCLKWQEVDLSRYFGSDPRYFPDHTLAEAKDFCRNPDRKSSGLWCFTSTDLNWESCELPYCGCSSEQFRCDSGLCVAFQTLCNRQNDCGDNSDELKLCYIGVSCTFQENNWCGYDVLPSESVFSWQRLSDKTPSKGTGPTADHTYGTVEKGHYMFTEATDYKNGDSSEMISPNININSVHCLQFYYHMYGDGMGSLTLYQYIPPFIKKSFYQLQGNHGNKWNPAHVNLPLGSYHVMFESIRGKSYQSDISIDDVKLISGACPVQNCSAQNFRCTNGACVNKTSVMDGIKDCADFSDELIYNTSCRMTVVGETYQGTQSSSNTGKSCLSWTKVQFPTRDNYFPDAALADAVNFCRNPNRNPGGPWCFVSNGTWEYCTIPFCGDCGKDQFKCDNGLCIDKVLLCDAKDNCGDRSDEVRTCVRSATCSFDDRFMCGYFVDHRSSYRWHGSWEFDKSSSAKLQVPTTPVGDFVLAQDEYSSVDDTTTLTSPKYNTTGEIGICFTISYYVHGATVGRLALYLAYDVTDYQQVWEVYGDQGNRWQTVNISSVITKPSFVLEFKATRGHGKYDVIAIGSVSVLNGVCVHNGCPADSYGCDNGKCVNTSYLCDGVNDCLDFSDELNCTCESYQLRCDNGVCISKSFMCNDENDCGDNSDEHACGPRILCSNRSPHAFNFTRNMSLSVDQSSSKHSKRRLTPSWDEGNEPFRRVNDDYNLTNFLLSGSHQASDFIYRCTWSSGECSVDDFKTTITDFGVCYTFNDVASEDPKRTSTRTGSRFGLQLVLNIEEYEYMKGPNNDAGIKIFMHDQNEIPLVRDLGFAVAPGTHALIGLKISNVSSLLPPWGRCGEKQLEYYKNYTSHRCQRECETVAAITRCHCRAAYMPEKLDNSSPICDLSTYFTCVLTDGDGDIQNTSCPCPEPCQRTIFEPVLSVATLSKVSVEGILNSDVAKLREKFYRARDTQDRVESVNYVNDLRVLQNISTYYNLLRQFMQRHLNIEMKGSLLQTVQFAVDTLLKMYGNDKEKRLFHRLPELVEMFESTFGILNYSLSQEIGKVRYLLGILELHKSANTINGMLETAETLVGAASELKKVVASYFMKINDVSVIDCRDSCPETLYSSISKKRICENRKDGFLVLVSEIAQTADVIRTRALYCRTLCRNHSESYNNEEDCVILCMNQTDCVNDTKYCFTGFGKEDINYTNTATTRTLLSLIIDYNNKSGQFVRCVNEYFSLIGKIHTTLQSEYFSKPGFHVRDFAINSMDIEEEYEILFEDKISIDVLIKSYIDATISKKHLAEELQAGSLQRAIENIDGFVGRISHHFFLMKDSLKDFKIYLKDVYMKSFRLALDMEPYHFSSTYFSRIRTLAIWTRPIIMIQGNMIDVEYSLKSLVLENTNTTSVLLQFICNEAEDILSEHISAYFENVENKMETFEADLQDVKRQLKTSLSNIQSKLQKYSEENALNEYFVLRNFLTVDMFFAQLNYQHIKQHKAFEFEQLMSEIGGFMGLLLGASTLTVFELLDLFIYNMFLKCRETARPRVLRPEMYTANKLAISLPIFQTSNGNAKSTESYTSYMDGNKH